MKSNVFAGFVVALSATMSFAQSTTLTFDSSPGSCYRVRDTYVIQTQADQAHGTDPIVYFDGGGSPEIDGLLGFFGIFGSGADQIPFGAIIESATLTLHVVNPSCCNTARVHRMLQPWSEMDTWDYMVDGIATDGCEATEKPDAVVPAGGPGPISINVTAGLIGWSLGQPNYGWVFPRTPDNGDPDGWGFAASEEPTESMRPRLSVTFRPPCPADVNENGIVDVNDLLMIVGGWGNCP